MFGNSMVCARISSGALALIVTLAGSSAVAQSLPPMPEPPAWPVGTVFHAVEDGERAWTKLVRVEGSKYTWQDQDGCAWIEDRSLGFFAPSIAWQNCGTTGTTKVRRKIGSIFPLKTGNKVQYRARGKTKGANEWDGNRTCRVAGQERIRTHSGTHETYKVVCRTKWRIMTWYMSPEAQAQVKYVQRPTSADSYSERSSWELTRIAR